jgi:hypothetical protein
MSRCFITQQVPMHLVVKYGISQAGVNFCNKLVNTGVFDNSFAFTISSIAEDLTMEFEKDPNYSYIQFRKFRHIGFGKVFNLSIENFMFIKKSRKFNHIWFYNLTKGNVLAYCVLKYFLFKKVYIVMADFRPEKRLSIKSVIKPLINVSNGIISLSSRSVFSNKKFICIPGIVSKKSISLKERDKNKKSFLLSGVLNEATGIQMAIDVFKKLPNINLTITGLLDDIYISQINGIPNINYLGYLSYKEYEELLENISFGLSFRNPDLAVNQNNFPSKILDYFSRGIVVISTIDYPEIPLNKYLKTDYDIINIISIIKSAFSMSDSELFEFHINKKLLLDHFSEEAWENAILKIESK